MSNKTDAYEVVSPVIMGAEKRVPLAGPIQDFNGKTICAMRHTFRADETFQMIGELFQEKYSDIKFVSNTEMPDSTSASPKDAEDLTNVLKEKGCDVLLVGNGA